MRKKLEQLLIDTAVPLMADGERAEIGTRCRVGRVSVTSRVALAAASAIVSGRAMTMGVNQKTFYVLLTNQRLLVLPSHWLTFRPEAKIVLGVPRSMLQVSNFRRGITTSFQAAAVEDPYGVLLTFARTERSDADRLAAGLGLTG